MRNLRCWIAVASLVFIGCSGRSVYQMHTRYEKTSLPVHFDRDEVLDERSVSISVSRTRPQKAGFQVDAPRYTEFSFENAGSTVDGNVLWEFEQHHFGLGFGISPADARIFRLGGLWGYSLQQNRLLLSWAGGLFINNNVNHAQYEDWGIFMSWDGEEGEFHGSKVHLDLPLRFNAGFDIPGPVDPYASYSLNLLGIGIEDGGQTLGIVEGAGGLLVGLPLQLQLRLEASVMQAWMLDQKAVQGDRSTRILPGGRFELAKGF
jgi:hypothetical protein